MACVNCGEALDGPLSLSPAGANHAQCSDSTVEVSLPWLTTVEHARRTPLRDSIDTAVPPGPAWALAEAIEAHLGRGLRSRSVLATLTS
jgi:hypothetical protein